MSTADPAPILGVGTDLVDVPRFRRVVERTPGVIDRVFTDAERQAVAGRRDPVPGLAVRFAAKEAVLKSLGCGIFDVPLAQIEVVREESGAPRIVLHGAGNPTLCLGAANAQGQRLARTAGEDQFAFPAECCLAPLARVFQR